MGRRINSSRVRLHVRVQARDQQTSTTRRCSVTRAAILPGAFWFQDNSVAWGALTSVAPWCKWRSDVSGGLKSVAPWCKWRPDASGALISGVLCCQRRLEFRRTLLPLVPYDFAMFLTIILKCYFKHLLLTSLAETTCDLGFKYHPARVVGSIRGLFESRSHFYGLLQPHQSRRLFKKVMVNY